MSLLTFITNISRFITGDFGIAVITAAIAIAAIGAALGAVRWARVGEAIFAGAIVFSAAWIVTTWLQA
jgi:type IV secretory pathway VirB2 component (pilin)